MVLGLLSGYKLNVKKTTILTFSNEPPLYLKRDYQFSSKMGKIEYSLLEQPIDQNLVGVLDLDCIRGSWKSGILQYILKTGG